MRSVLLRTPEGQNEGSRGIHPSVAPGAREKNIIIKESLWKGGTKKKQEEIEKSAYKSLPPCIFFSNSRFKKT
jgi:hypothetical protein